MRLILLIAASSLCLISATKPPAGNSKEKPKTIRTLMLCIGTKDVLNGKIVGVHPIVCKPFEYKGKAGESPADTKDYS